MGDGINTLPAGNIMAAAEDELDELMSMMFDLVGKHKAISRAKMVATYDPNKTGEPPTPIKILDKLPDEKKAKCDLMYQYADHQEAIMYGLYELHNAILEKGQALAKENDKV